MDARDRKLKITIRKYDLRMVVFEGERSQQHFENAPRTHDIWNENPLISCTNAVYLLISTN
jgi:hypothetical protein